MSDIIGPINAAVTIGKGLFEINREYEKAEYKKMVIDLTDQLFQAQTEIKNLREDNQKLKEENHELKARRNEPWPPALRSGGWDPLADD